MTTIPTIEQELAYLSQSYPDFPQRVQRVRTAIEEGRIVSLSYIDEGSVCGCFYGHFVDLVDPDEAARIAGEVGRHLGQSVYDHTPIEILLALDGVFRETQETSEALATLYKALEPYVEAKQEEEGAVHG